MFLHRGPGDGEQAQVAQWLHRRGLAGLAYLFLQSLRPLNFLGSQGLLFLQPLLPLERWRDGAGAIARWLEEPEALEGFLAALEGVLKSDGARPGKEGV
ncbi:MAG: hypothetical protein ACP5SI_01315 [Chloroflexia bacterium]